MAKSKERGMSVMKLQEVKQMAKQRGLKAEKMKKCEIIRTIQTDEGNFPCYGTGNSPECGQLNCLWRQDCE
jgi:hypothetical protein